MLPTSNVDKTCSQAPCKSVSPLLNTSVAGDPVSNKNDRMIQFNGNIIWVKMVDERNADACKVHQCLACTGPNPTCTWPWSKSQFLWV